MYTKQNNKDVVLTAFFCSITILFHPTAAIHTAAGIFVFFLYKAVNRKGIIRSLIVVVMILLFTSFWWVNVIKNNGFSTFVAAGKSGMHYFSFYLNFLLFNITSEVGLTSIGVLALIGTFFYLSTKQTMIIVWMIFTFLAAPRSAFVFFAPIISMLAGYVLSEIIIKMDKLSDKNYSKLNQREPLSGFPSKLFLTLLIFQWSISSLIVVSEVMNQTLTDSQILAMDWIKSNTSSESDFLILNGEHPYRNALSEWFPSITNRRSIATFQGQEWVTDTNFSEVLDKSIEIQNCILQDPKCLLDWQNNYELDYDYLYLQKYVVTNDFFEVPATALNNYLIDSEDFSLVYESESIEIFKKIKNY